MRNTIRKIVPDLIPLALFIFMFISLLFGCSQANENTIADNQESENDSYLSKKKYQQKLTKWLKPYQMDVQQGNIINEEIVSNLKIGATKQQVTQLLGTSVLSESPAKDVWLYVYTDAVNGITKKEHKLILSFKDGKLRDIKQDVKQQG